MYKCLMLAFIVTATRVSTADERPFSEVVSFGASCLLGRDTSGPSWIEFLTSDLEVPLLNYAAGGARPSAVIGQIGDYLGQHEVTEKSLMVLNCTTGVTLIGQTNEDRAVEGADQISQMIDVLLDAGAKHFLIPTVLPAGTVPRGQVLWPDREDEINGVMIEYDRLVQERADAIAMEGRADFFRPDHFGLLRDATKNPEDYGFGSLEPSQSSLSPELHLYWDDRHTTSAFGRVKADITYLELIGEQPSSRAAMPSVGGFLSEDFNVFGIDDGMTGQKLPDGWTTTGPQRLIPETRVSRAFRGGRYGSTRGNGEVFNAGSADDEDRALVTSFPRSALSSEVDLAIDLVDGRPKAVRLSFDLEAWGVDRTVREPGTVAFDLDVQGLSGEASVGTLLADMISKDVTPPASGERVNGNQPAYRTRFDSGVIDLRAVDVDGLNIRWSTIGDVGSEGWAFGLDNFTLRTAREGDANVDGVVDFADFLMLSSSFGASGTWRDGDFDQNGVVQFPDFLLLSANYGPVPGAVATVPEPAGLPLGALTLVLLIATRRQQMKEGKR